MPKISINILTWNSERDIETCLQHAFLQNMTDGEINVIDNGSTDATLSILEKYTGRIRLLRNPVNLGYSGGHNRGIRESNGEYLQLLNPDVFLSPSYCEMLIGFLDRHPSYGGCIGKIYQSPGDPADGDLKIDTCGLTILRSRQFIARFHDVVPDPSGDSSRWNKITEVFGVDGMAPVYRKSMLEDIKTGGSYFDESFFAYCEDQDLSWRARLYGWQFGFVPEALGFHKRTWKPGSLKARKNIPGPVRRMALRNHYLMIIKNDFASSLLRSSLHMALRFIRIVVYALFTEPLTLLAFYDVMKSLPAALVKRRIILAGRIMSSRQFHSWLNR